MPVAGDDLGRDRLALEAEALEDRAARTPGDVAEYVPTAPEMAPTAYLSERPLQSLHVALCLHREPGELDAERRRLGMHAVGASDADAVDMLARALAERRDKSRAPVSTISPAARSCSAVAVSSTSLEVRPKWIHRPASPADALSTSTNAATS